MRDDLISREDTKQAIRYKFKTLAERCEINEVLNSMPSVQPEQKTGQWISNRHTDTVLCSECKKCYGDEFKFCPNCGAKMEV